MSLTIDAAAVFEECEPGFPEVCVATTTISFTGTIAPYPPIDPGVTVSTVSGSGTLSAPPDDCDGAFVFALDGAAVSATFEIDF